MYNFVTHLNDTTNEEKARNCTFTFTVSRHVEPLELQYYSWHEAQRYSLTVKQTYRQTVVQARTIWFLALISDCFRSRSIAKRERCFSFFAFGLSHALPNICCTCWIFFRTSGRILILVVFDALKLMVNSYDIHEMMNSLSLTLSVSLSLSFFRWAEATARATRAPTRLSTL